MAGSAAGALAAGGAVRQPRARKRASRRENVMRRWKWVMGVGAVS
jgi:hypothetical protein